MKLFSLIKKSEEIRIPPNHKILPAEDFSALLSAKELLEKTQADSLDYRQSVAQECEALKEQAENAGFESGLKQWNEQIAFLEKEALNVRKEMEEAIVPLALTAVKKIIGKELEMRPETIVDIVSTALKTVSQHHRIAIYVNRSDLEIVESHRAKLKELFDHLHSMTIAPREDVEPGGCIIETEVGIINAQLSSQLKALESAFHSFLKNNRRKDST